MKNFNRRKDAVEAWNKAMEDSSYVPSASRKAWWKTKKSVFGIGSGDGKRTIGLAGACVFRRTQIGRASCRERVS